MSGEISLDPERLENRKHLDGGAIRAACPACRKAGSDKSGDHLLIQPGGKFGCAANPNDREHRQEIFRLAGKPLSTPAATNGSGKRIVATYDYHDAAGKLLFQVVRYEPKDFRQRRPAGKGGWIWNMDGVEKVLFRLPEIIRAIAGGKFIFLTEGEKDTLAMVQRGFDATCNPGGAAKKADGEKWLNSYTETLRGADVCIIADKDGDGRKHAQIVAGKLHGVAKSVRVIELPDTNGQVKDAADFFAAGGEAAGIVALIDAAPIWAPTAPDSNRADIMREYLGEESEQAASEKGFTIRTPDEILAMQFDDSDRILGDHLLDDSGQLALLGAGGVGKSRLLLLMLACIAGARRFLTFDTFKPEMKLLVLQTENSNRRLQQDLAPIKSWLGDDWPRFTERVTIHTIETDSDAFVNLDDPDAVARIEAAIQKHKPDGIAIDPLADFAAGDLNKDADMKATLQMLSRVCRRGNPKRAIIVLHHAITGRGGAAKATGYDRASFARNSKMLHAWARGQINLAPVDADNNDRLIIGCGKCSNGREFQTFAVRLNPDTMIYEVDPTVDVRQWERDITGTKDNAPLMNPDRVRELCAVTGSSKAALAKSIMDDCGCYRGSSYRYITRAEQSKKITFNKSHEAYFRK
jgi:AAA domain